MPYLVLEHRRLQPWKIAGLWLGDIMALIWFGRFALAHAVLGAPLVSMRLSDRRRRLWLVGIAVAGAMLVDLGFTLYLMYEERVAYAQAPVASAEVVALYETKRELATWYELECRFRDRAGVSRQAHVRVEAWHHVLPPALPVAVARMLVKGKPGQAPIPLRYDPSFPARAWVDGLGWEDDNGLYWFSLLVLFFQAILGALFVLLLVQHTVGGVLPWWWGTFRVLPLAVEAFWLLAAGLIDRVLDRLG
jgi:hypothetical protein